MKAMILAAGLGTRLKPLTDDRPKALVEVGGRTLLEIALYRLRSYGITDVIVNVHHFAEMMLAYLESKNSFGMRIEVSREEQLLDTGGGLKKAAEFFLRDGDDPFILHNVDIVSTIDLERMVRFHIESDALATLAVKQRQTSRYLLFDEKLQLRGRRSGGDRADQSTPASSSLRALGFCGIHVISPRIFSLMAEGGAFSIIDSYLNLAAREEKILAFEDDEAYWWDVGTSANVARAAQAIDEMALFQ